MEIIKDKINERGDKLLNVDIFFLNFFYIVIIFIQDNIIY